MSNSTYQLLAADDDPTVGLLLQAALAGQGFAVTVVDNGMEALAQALGGAYDLVLLDVEMPGMDGLSVCQALRKALPSSLPVVLVTGRNDAAFFETMAELQASHLPKPINWSTLGAQLRNLLAGTP